MRRASNIAAFAAIALCVLGVGGVHTAVAGAAATLAIVAAGLQISHLRSRDRLVIVSFVGLGLSLAAAACLFQLLPTPTWVHAVLNPTGLGLYEHGLELAGADAYAWRPLSLDPMQTADRCIRYVALAAMATWAANVRSRRAWRSFAVLFLPLAGLSFVVGLVLHLSHSTSLFGLYEPTVGFRGPSTFISTNHGAVFFGLAALVASASALSFRHEKRVTAALMGVAGLSAAAIAIAHRSDGVILALAFCCAVAVVVRWLRRGRPTTIRRDVALGLGLLLVFFIVAVWWLDVHHLAVGFAERVLFSGEHGGRLELLNGGLSALSDYWRFGAGAGAIGSMLPAYLDWSNLVPASIPLIENDTLEVLLSFGVPLGAAMLAGAGYQLLAVRKHAADGHHSPRYAVAWVSGIYVFLVAQLHFPLFALGIGLPTVAWLELLWSRRTKPTRDGRVFRSGHIAIKPRTAIVACLGLSVGMLAAAQAHYTWFAAPERTEQRADTLAHEMWLRPATHATYVHLAEVALRDGDLQRAQALADYAVERSPSPRVRLYRARVLARVDRALGAAAYSDLFARGHRDGRYLLSFLSNVRDDDVRLEVLDRFPDLWIAAANRMQRLDGPDAASSFVVKLAEQHPNDATVYRLASTTYLRLGRPVLAELWAELVREAERSGGWTEHAAPELRARALRASGRTDAARRVLNEALLDPLANVDTHRLALQMRPAPNDRGPLSDIRKHHDRLCAPPVPQKDVHLCWSAEAWILETEGDFRGAKHVLSRLRRRLNDPIPLAQLFFRAKRCDRLDGLVHELEPGGRRARVEALSKRCR